MFLSCFVDKNSLKVTKIIRCLYNDCRTSSLLTNCSVIFRRYSLSHHLGCSVNQRANVISCVTVHDSQDSDSSTCSPLSPKRLPNFMESSGQGSKSLAVVMPSLKTQPWEGVTSGTPSLSLPRLSNLDNTLVLFDRS